MASNPLTALQQAKHKVQQIDNERAEACWNQDSQKSARLQRKLELALDDLIAEAQTAVHKVEK